MDLGKNIEKYRKKAGLSREKLAHKCGGKFTSIHLMRVEKGMVKNPGIEMIKAIAETLNISIDKLVKST
jgi:transcriptional regulator with XRE-family HTH domain